jgi:hypothetical protein
VSRDGLRGAPKANRNHLTECPLRQRRGAVASPQGRLCPNGHTCDGQAWPGRIGISDSSDPASPHCLVEDDAHGSTPDAGYPLVLSHLGDHIRKKRMDWGLRANQLVGKLGANEHPCPAGNPGLGAEPSASGKRRCRRTASANPNHFTAVRIGEIALAEARLLPAAASQWTRRHTLMTKVHPDASFTHSPGTTSFASTCASSSHMRSPPMYPVRFMPQPLGSGA